MRPCEVSSDVTARNGCPLVRRASEVLRDKPMSSETVVFFALRGEDWACEELERRYGFLRVKGA